MKKKKNYRILKQNKKEKDGMKQNGYVLNIFGNFSFKSRKDVYSSMYYFT